MDPTEWISLSITPVTDNPDDGCAKAKKVKNNALQDPVMEYLKNKCEKEAKVKEEDIALRKEELAFQREKLELEQRKFDIEKKRTRGRNG